MYITRVNSASGNCLLDQIKPNKKLTGTARENPQVFLKLSEDMDFSIRDVSRHSPASK